MVTVGIQKIGIGELKKDLSRIIEEISKSGESVTITKRGVPVAQISPISQMGKVEYIRKYLKGSVTHFEETHHDTTEDWEILKDDTDT